jgi:hypothetical protein
MGRQKSCNERQSSMPRSWERVLYAFLAVFCPVYAPTLTLTGLALLARVCSAPLVGLESSPETKRESKREAKMEIPETSPSPHKSRKEEEACERLERTCREAQRALSFLSSYTQSTTVYSPAIQTALLLDKITFLLLLGRTAIKSQIDSNASEIKAPLDVELKQLKDQTERDIDAVIDGVIARIGNISTSYM